MNASALIGASDGDAAPLSKRLREATRAPHAALEATGPFRALAEGPVDLSLYRATLATLLAILAPLEAAVAGCDDPWVGGFGHRSRVPALRRDLARLGAMPAEGTRLYGSERISPETAAGLIYVLEGSRLGGVLIARRLAAILPEPGPSALSFFAGGTGSDPSWGPSSDPSSYPSSGPSWAEVRRHLDAIPDRLDPGAVVAGAIRGFAAFAAAGDGVEDIISAA